MTDSKRQRLNLNAPPLYEMRLLSGLAFFLGRPTATQALAALCLYLRQSEGRIMAQANFYGSRLGMSGDEFLDLIYTQPDKARDLMESIEINAPIHSEVPDIYSNDDE
jgi:hypothetical protein